MPFPKSWRGILVNEGAIRHAKANPLDPKCPLCGGPDHGDTPILPDICPGVGHFPPGARSNLPPENERTWPNADGLLEPESPSAAAPVITKKKSLLQSALEVAQEESERADGLLDRAESIICNAIPMMHYSQEEWDRMVKAWRDEKHGINNPNPNPNPNTQ